MKNICRVVVLLAVLAAFAACGSSSDSSTDTSADVFPSSVTPDMSGVSSSGAATVLSNVAVKAAVGKALGDGGLQAPIAASTNTTEMIHVVSSSFLSGVSSDCNSSITTTSTSVDCTATINGTAVPIHISFAVFDYDGDGTNDGTGTASVSGTTPVAFRIWKSADQSRVACGLIYTLPTYSGTTLTNAGKGSITLQPNSVISAFNSSVYTKITWDETVSATSKTYDLYITGTLPTLGSEVPIVTLMHAYLTEDSSSGTVVNTFQVGGTFDDTAEVGPPDNRFYAIQYASTWKNSGTNIGFINKGYQIDRVTPATNDFNGQLACAVISTAQPASGGDPTVYTACTDEGLATLSSANFPTTYNYTSADAATYAQFPAAFTASY